MKIVLINTLIVIGVVLAQLTDEDILYQWNQKKTKSTSSTTTATTKTNGKPTIMAVKPKIKVLNPEKSITKIATTTMANKPTIANKPVTKLVKNPTTTEKVIPTIYEIPPIEEWSPKMFSENYQPEEEEDEEPIIAKDKVPTFIQTQIEIPVKEMHQPSKIPKNKDDAEMVLNEDKNHDQKINETNCNSSSIPAIIYSYYQVKEHQQKLLINVIETVGVNFIIIMCYFICKKFVEKYKQKINEPVYPIQENLELTPQPTEPAQEVETPRLIQV